jgi:hypothetical protein
MNDTPETASVTRTRITVRLLYTMLFLAVFCILKAIILLTTLFQFISLYITLKPSEPVRTCANQVVTYAYRVWRYVTLNANARPFPFADFPPAMEPSESEVIFP